MEQFAFQSNPINDDFLFSNDSRSGYLSSIVPESYLRNQSPSSQDKVLSPNSSQVQSYDSSSTNYSFCSVTNGDLWEGCGAETGAMSSQTSPCLTEMQSGGLWIDEPLWELTASDFPMDSFSATSSLMQDPSSCCSLPQASDTYSTSVSSLAEGFGFC